MKLTTNEVKKDILRLLTSTEMQDLIQLYKTRDERYHCMSIYNHCHWTEELDKVIGNNNKKWMPFKKIYYTHRYGNLAANGTYISIQRDELLSVQFHTLEESLQELRECIEETKLIDWNRGPLLTAIHTDIADEIVPLITKLGGAVDHECPCTCFILAQSVALKIKVPSIAKGYDLRHLEERHADFIHEKWPHNASASVDFIRGMINFNLAIGVFRLEDDELVAWALQNEFYGLGLLQVIPEEQGKGFAKLVTNALMKKIAVRDKSDITAFVVEDNHISENILLKTGFKKDCVTIWIQLKEL